MHNGIERPDPTSGLLVCSHRGPVAYQRASDNLLPQAVGPGGLVPLIVPVLEHYGGTWMFAASSSGDRVVAQDNQFRLLEYGFKLEILGLPRRAHRLHYRVVSVEYLARLFHYLFGLGTSPVFDLRFVKAWESYRLINDIYARAIVAHHGATPVFIEDHHLMLAAASIRRLDPSFDQRLFYFHHVPWCEPAYFGVLPAPVRDEILLGLLACDSIGFHSRRWANAFLACCERFLPQAAIASGGVRIDKRTVSVRVTPGAFDPNRVTAVAQSTPCEDWSERIEKMRDGRWALVRVDRADLWKNLLRGFLAFERLLERRPELAQSLWFLALATPTRTWIPEYRRYLRDCETTAKRINTRFPTSASGPITLLVADPTESEHARALAGLRCADAVLVNPIFDGLNLVAKEAVLVSQRASVLILSRNAGVYDELSSAALPVNPFDVFETADAIEEAFEMSITERATRWETLRRIVTARTPEAWARERLTALAHIPVSTEKQ